MKEVNAATTTALKPEPKIHARHEALIFRAKAFLLQIRRGTQNLTDASVRRFEKADEFANQSIIAESKTALWTEKDRVEEMPLMAGKIENLRLAIRKINGVEIPAGQTFSFWKQIGRASKRKGFVRGRELREGCIIPNVGGGLCQLSNALYDAALKANFEIVERHAHTQVVSGSLAEKNRDATVFWNYVDLRFRSTNAFRIEAELTATHLIVRFKAKEKQQNLVQLKSRNALSILNNPQPNSCMTCGVGECFRSEKTAADGAIDFGSTAFLLDEFSPEFDEYIKRTRAKKDFLFVPLDGKRFKKANYAWSTEGFAKTKQSLVVTLIRSYQSRKLAAQGAARQKSLLAMAEKLAESYAKNLTFDATHVVVSQNLLPFLWKNGHLGGRTFDVLMNALPMRALQQRLDFAASLHPESNTLGDFRAENWLPEAESAALAAARKIITPHTEIAALFAEKAELLDWQTPQAKEIQRRQNDKFTIVFPASTFGRKGCYELREALQGLKNIKLVTLGAIIEDADFWQDFDWEKRAGGNDWFAEADLVVLPAFVEHKPRRLMQAAAQKIPVIASTACGVENVEGITSVETGNSETLREEILKVLKGGEKVSETVEPVFV